MIIGWKFQIEEDNGDYGEWHRLKHIESPIYTTKDAAKQAIILCKKKMLDNAKVRNKEFISYQIDFELKHQRNVNKFLCDCQRSLMNVYAGILKMMKHAEVVPVYAKTTATEDWIEQEFA